MSMDEAVRCLRSDTSNAELVRDGYLGRDVRDSARRFAESEEWREVLRLLDGRVQGAIVLDLGAGTGLASVAFANEGAERVIAVEPDSSDEVGRGAMARLQPGSAVEIIDAVGEGIPLSDGVADIAYCRQVLHHATDLDEMLAEIGRVLKPGGVLLACREHVVDDEAQLRAFLAAHPVNRLAGGENAFTLDRYLEAIARAGLHIRATVGPWDSVINAFPSVRSNSELEGYAVAALRRKFGSLGRVAAHVSLLRWLAWQRIKRPLPGRLYTFVAVKDGVG